jgi:hypothetical protein
MKYLLFSDVHANLPAFTVFLESASAGFKDALPVCLGDTVGYGADPAACVTLLRGLDGFSVAGNHERMLREPALQRYANFAARFAIE